ncbi:protein DEEPER ROOTING 1-like isoform X2 [Salvia miltiorrhiza]|uniref:protein DEEPER ROOTING 1-like isoform X2 n=1 Tax=Salvia miltiorrhiza TaxID=226208 RepID=UPI0025AD7017|nr:protein DEEPER ROOTING 1-like isoform X2 [Salvia miltiorrhiza]
MKLLSWMQSKLSAGHGHRLLSMDYKDEMHKHVEGIRLDSEIPECNFSSAEENELGQDIDRTIRIILGRCKHGCQNKTATGKKSLSFLVRKLFLRTTSTPTTFRDAFQESRMEKLMRAMLAKKIHPRNSSANQNAEHGFKWDKTDSEFIVLEI